jgi:lipopolysaccharide export system protein LptC
MAPAGPGLYSRAVAILKVGLPLIAIAMLAGLFVTSEGPRGGGELVFSPADLAALGQGMRVTKPVFSGVTDAGDRFRFTAAEVTPDAAPPTRAAIDALAGRIDFADGRGVDVRARTGDLDLRAQSLRLEGEVALDSDDGYAFDADRVDVDLRAGSMVATGGVGGDGPMGRIDARTLTVSPPAEAGVGRRFLFEDAVRVVYDPAAAPAAAPTSE